MEQFLQLIERYGIDTCGLALLIGISTGIAKIPLKILSKKKRLGNRVNKYITLLPIVFGLVYAGVYRYYTVGRFWSEDTAVLATTAASLSLAVYAILEKFFMKNTAADKPKQTEPAVDTAPPSLPEAVPQKFILGRKNDETETETARISGQADRL